MESTQLSIEEILAKKQEFESEMKQLQLQHKEEQARLQKELGLKQRDEINLLKEEYQNFTEENIIRRIKEKSDKLYELERQRWSELAPTRSKLLSEFHEKKERKKELKKICANMVANLTKKYKKISKIPRIDRYSISSEYDDLSYEFEFLSPEGLVLIWLESLLEGIPAEEILEKHSSMILNSYGEITFKSDCSYPSPLTLRELAKLAKEEIGVLSSFSFEGSVGARKEILELKRSHEEIKKEIQKFSETFYTSEMRKMAEDLASDIGKTVDKLSVRINRRLYNGNWYIGEYKIDWSCTFGYGGFREVEPLELEKHHW